VHGQFYKLKHGVAGFVLLPDGASMEVTIPSGSVLRLIQPPSKETGFTRVGYGSYTCTISIRELQKYGVLVDGGLFVMTKNGR